MQNPGLHCHQLTFKRPGSGLILDRISASFEAGFPALVTGPAGVGKSTLLHLLGGLLKPTSGEVSADDEPVSRWTASHRDKWRRQVGFVFQHLHLLTDLSVLENVLLPCIPVASAWTDITRRAHELLSHFDLVSMMHQPLQVLSGGQRQRVAIARALISQPRFLLLDEPTSFQDDIFANRLLKTLVDFASRKSCIVVCSHDVRLRNEASVFTQKYRLHTRGMDLIS